MFCNVNLMYSGHAFSYTSTKLSYFTGIATESKETKISNKRNIVKKSQLAAGRPVSTLQRETEDVNLGLPPEKQMLQVASSLYLYSDRLRRGMKYGDHTIPGTIYSDTRPCNLGCTENNTTIGKRVIKKRFCELKL